MSNCLRNINPATLFGQGTIKQLYISVFIRGNLTIYQLVLVRLCLPESEQSCQLSLVVEITRYYFVRFFLWFNLSAVLSPPGNRVQFSDIFPQKHRLVLFKGSDLLRIWLQSLVFLQALKEHEMWGMAVL